MFCLYLWHYLYLFYNRLISTLYVQVRVSIEIGSVLPEGMVRIATYFYQPSIKLVVQFTSSILHRLLQENITFILRLRLCFRLHCNVLSNNFHRSGLDQRRNLAKAVSKFNFYDKRIKRSTLISIVMASNNNPSVYG